MDAKNAAGMKVAPYMQNRELSWLDFNERVLDQGLDQNVPLLERLNFVSIFWSNLQEFFMVRVGSLTDLSLLKKTLIDSKSGLTPSEQLSVVYARCHELYPKQEEVFKDVTAHLSGMGVHHLRPKDLSDAQREYIENFTRNNIAPFLSPQVINSRHPFPHLENGGIYVVVRLDHPKEERKATDEKKAKNVGAKDVTLGLVPMPSQCDRVIPVPSENGEFSYLLLEHAIELSIPKIFSMYTVKHTNVICVTRNADLDVTEGEEEAAEFGSDYREHMKRILKRRGHLSPVRLESERKLSDTVQNYLLEKLNLQPHQVFVTSVPLDLSYTFGLASRLQLEQRSLLTNPPFSPQWPVSLKRNKSIISQIQEKEVLLSYPYESMDPFVKLLEEAAIDPQVVSIKITLYRLASQSKLAEALISAAENGKEVTALFELRARFDESNNIVWSQRFEEAGCKVIYGFQNYKVHSKICSIIRKTDEGLQYITQMGTGNYNEKTAKLYTDLSHITTDPDIGRDAVEFFQNMSLENASDSYKTLLVAPLQIKPYIMGAIDEQIKLAKKGKPCGLFFKTNSITDVKIIKKIMQASNAGVPVTLFVRGISCIVPGVEGYTENVRVVSIVGRLLEHSRIYGFGPHDDMRIYLSSADLMTRNMDKRVEVAWPVKNEELRKRIVNYIDLCLRDTAKLRELQPDTTYTPIGYFAEGSRPLLNSQQYLIDATKAAWQQAQQTKDEAALASRWPQLTEDVATKEDEPEASVIEKKKPEAAPEVIEKTEEVAPVSREAKRAPEPEAYMDIPKPSVSVSRPRGGLSALFKRLFGKK